MEGFFTFKSAFSLALLFFVCRKDCGMKGSCFYKIELQNPITVAINSSEKQPRKPLENGSGYEGDKTRNGRR